MKNIFHTPLCDNRDVFSLFDILIIFPTYQEIYLWVHTKYMCAILHVNTQQTYFFHQRCPVLLELQVMQRTHTSRLYIDSVGQPYLCINGIFYCGGKEFLQMVPVFRGIGGDMNIMQNLGYNVASYNAAFSG